jgi:hypothetical protein
MIPNRWLLLLLAWPVLLSAQVDFSGPWESLYHEDAPERLPGPEIGDYLGLPINQAARLRTDSWDADRLSIVSEYQCRPNGADYSTRGLSTLRIWREIDPATQKLVAFRTHMQAMSVERTIWMDSRAHPPAWVSHTWQGFSTGVWDGNTLVVTTTHLKPNYIRRNGVPRSDKAVVTEWFRLHGDYLTVTQYIDDPVFLNEPLVRSSNWVRDPNQRMTPAFCDPGPEVPGEVGAVPHHLPGTNPFLAEVADRYGIPRAATRGGTDTMYPEYRKTMTKPEVAAPAQCERYCFCITLTECPPRDSR